METVQEVTRTDTGRPIITVDEKEVHDHLAELVRVSVEQTLNQLLDAEADDLMRRQALRALPRNGSTPGPGITPASCTPRPAR